MSYYHSSMEQNKVICGDSYEVIKSIPDKSVDLVYIDIPYLFEKGGCGTSDISKRVKKLDNELKGKQKMNEMIAKAERLKELMDNAKDKIEYKKYHARRDALLNKINLNSSDITLGIDYKIFDELVRVMKNIYIYIYGVTKNKYTIL